MLRRAKELNDYKLGARDGEVGKVKEFYFDDQSWTVRYLIADTGGWLSGRRVLISPYALDPADEDGKVIPVDLTRAQIEKSPSPDTDRPVSRQYEWDYYSYYGWPAYWGGPYAWGMGAYPTVGGRDGPTPLVVVIRKRKILTSVARRMWPAVTSRPRTGRSVTSRILSSMTRRGPSVT